MNKIKKMDRRRFIGTISATSAGMAISGLTPAFSKEAASNDLSTEFQSEENEAIQISTFDIDATPPVGSYLTYEPMIGSYDLGLRAKGIVLKGAGMPVVLCAIDWIGVNNESQDVFKQVLAASAHTLPERVIVHCLHQHDAPICDFSVEKALREVDVEPKLYDGTHQRAFLLRLSKAVENSLEKQQPVTHLGTGKALVSEVASNRRVLNEEGIVVATRFTTCTDPELRAKPEGLIDPELTLLSFWNEDKPLAVLTFYATHPQSYYRQGIACPDFPGIARFYRQLSVPDALHVHFNGAGGNIGAGKYNDGSHENRLILAKRLAEGMEKAWKNVTKKRIKPADLDWEALPVALPPRYDDAEWERRLNEAKEKPALADNFSDPIWVMRQKAGFRLALSCLRIGKTRVLFMPGELFVEYQLAAKNYRKDLDVSMAAYCDVSPGYICTKEAFLQGGYEVDVSIVAPEAEDILMDAIHKLLK
ncbi:MAG: hypothetical protein LBR49_05655 [Tannerella sp.]|jgi:hypothetical protein|nr:hypothetical protein [Tannerella sp.]